MRPVAMRHTILTADRHEYRAAARAAGAVDNTIAVEPAGPGHWFVTSANTAKVRAAAEAAARRATGRG